jgi:hypothetical protein
MIVRRMFYARSAKSDLTIDAAGFPDPSKLRDARYWANFAFSAATTFVGAKDATSPPICAT